MHPLDLFKYCPKCGSSHFEVRNEKQKNVPTAVLLIILIQVPLRLLLF